MGWQDRDYRRKPPDDSDDEFVDRPEDDYEPDDDSDDEDFDDADPDAPDTADIGSDEPALVRCPECGKVILEEAEQRHHCGHFMMDEGPSAGWPVWMWIGMALALLTAVLWGLFG